MPRLSPTTTAANVGVRSVAVASRLVPLPSPSLPRQCATEEGGREKVGKEKRRIELASRRARCDAGTRNHATDPRVLDRRAPSQSPLQLNHNTCAVRKAEREWMHDAARARQNVRRATARYDWEGRERGAQPSSSLAEERDTLCRNERSRCSLARSLPGNETKVLKEHVGERERQHKSSLRQRRERG